MDFWNSLDGQLQVALTSAEPENALAGINALGIGLSRLQKEGALTYRFCMRRRDYQKLSRFCEKRGESLKIIRRLGLFWKGKALLARPVLLGGFLILFGLAVFLPSRIYFVKVEGNAGVPDRKILEAAEESGIRFGASRRQIRSERVKNALLGALPELQWVGVNTAGCVATISVRERAEASPNEAKWDASDVVAARDGFILSGTVTSGSALFQVGQTVQEGQVLISGLTDCGICVRVSRAEGEILAQTSRSLEAVTPMEQSCRSRQVGSKRKISLLLGKKRINFGKDSGILDTTCGRMYSQHYVTLPGGFRLPLALCVETYTMWETEPGSAALPQAERILGEFAGTYLKSQMVAGTILERFQSVQPGEGVFRLTGRYVCTEMIGREQQIGDTNGENRREDRKCGAG